MCATPTRGFTLGHAQSAPHFELYLTFVHAQGASHFELLLTFVHAQSAPHSKLHLTIERARAALEEAEAEEQGLRAAATSAAAAQREAARTQAEFAAAHAPATDPWLLRFDFESPELVYKQRFSLDLRVPGDARKAALLASASLWLSESVLDAAAEGGKGASAALAALAGRGEVQSSTGTAAEVAARSADGVGDLLWLGAGASDGLGSGGPRGRVGRAGNLGGGEGGDGEAAVQLPTFPRPYGNHWEGVRLDGVPVPRGLAAWRRRRRPEGSEGLAPKGERGLRKTPLELAGVVEAPTASLAEWAHGGDTLDRRRGHIHLRKSKAQSSGAKDNEWWSSGAGGEEEQASRDGEEEPRKRGGTEEGGDSDAVKEEEKEEEEEEEDAEDASFIAARNMANDDGSGGGEGTVGASVAAAQSEPSSPSDGVRRDHGREEQQQQTEEEEEEVSDCDDGDSDPGASLLETLGWQLPSEGVLEFTFVHGAAACVAQTLLHVDCDSNPARAAAANARAYAGCVADATTAVADAANGGAFGRSTGVGDAAGGSGAAAGGGALRGLGALPSVLEEARP